MAALQNNASFGFLVWILRLCDSQHQHVRFLVLLAESDEATKTTIRVNFLMQTSYAKFLLQDIKEVSLGKGASYRKNIEDQSIPKSEIFLAVENNTTNAGNDFLKPFFTEREHQNLPVCTRSKILAISLTKRHWFFVWN